MYIYTHFTELKVAVLFEKAAAIDADTLRGYANALTLECKYFKFCLKKCILIIPCVSSIFYSCCAFDTLGDKEGTNIVTLACTAALLAMLFAAPFASVRARGFYTEMKVKPERATEA